MIDLLLIQEAARASAPHHSSPPAFYQVERTAHRPVTPACIGDEAKRQGLDVLRILAVMRAEGGRVGQFVRNTDGSYDIGPMQINSIHLDELAKTYGKSQKQLAELLAYDGCFNVAVGAWMLRKRTNEAGGDFWYGIGRYHSKTERHRDRYILRVHTHMMNLASQAGGQADKSKGS